MTWRHDIMMSWRYDKHRKADVFIWLRSKEHCANDVTRTKTEHKRSQRLLLRLDRCERGHGLLGKRRLLHKRFRLCSPSRTSSSQTKNDGELPSTNNKHSKSRCGIQVRRWNLLACGNGQRAELTGHRNLRANAFIAVFSSFTNNR